MKNLRSRFERFCFRHRSKGIPNLMLYVSLGSALVCIIDLVNGSNLLTSLLFFHKGAILQGQVWRLFTYAFTYNTGSLLLTAISLLCYYALGRHMEQMWGTLRFNLFYLTGLILMDIYCMLFDGQASVTYLNLSLFLGYATLFPDAQFLLMFIIPIKARFFALFDLLLVVVDLIIYPFPYNLFPVIALANYFLFFGKDVLNILPLSWRRKFRKPAKHAPKATPIPFTKESTPARPSYTHRCTVCGRTDVSNPELEFRYCSRCNGYYCYCQDHISNHAHID